MLLLLSYSMTLFFFNVMLLVEDGLELLPIGEASFDGAAKEVVVVIMNDARLANRGTEHHAKLPGLCGLNG